MRHHDYKRKFGRERGGRRALLRSLARELIIRGRIETTLARAKEVRPMLEKLVTASREVTLAARRRTVSRVGRDAAEKLIAEIAPRYISSPGGYTRIIRLGRRGGDQREMSVIEFVDIKS